MAGLYNYGGQVVFDQSIDFKNKAPLDIRVSVPTLADLDKIEYPYVGLISYVSERDMIYVCRGFNSAGRAIWSMPNAGIPIYDQEIIDQLSETNNGEVPDTKYISVMNKETDLLRYPKGVSYKMSGEGNYADILFQAVRELQNEVTRLRNSFKYGIHSYQGTDTAMAFVVGENIEEDAKAAFDEPIWAVDEHNLSSVYACKIGKNWDDSFTAVGQSTVNAEKDGFIRINGAIEWSDGKIENAVEATADNKLFIFLRATGLDINVQLYDADGGGLTKYINLENIDNTDGASIYNVMLCISRTYTSDESDVIIDGAVPEAKTYGHNYVFVSISDGTNNTLAEGYVSADNRTLTDEITESDGRYFIGAVRVSDCDLYKLNIYSKFQDFSHEVIPQKPDDDTYRYKAAHITIRAVDTIDELNKVTKQLPENELVWQKDKKALWIKSNGLMVPIGSAAANPSNPDDNNNTMTDTEILEILEKKGIIYKSETGLQFNDVSGITFINEHTKKRYEFTPDNAGQLTGREQPIKTFNNLLADVKWTYKADSMEDAAYSIRGFFGTYNMFKNGMGVNNASLDYGLGSDRVKIGAVYSPFKSQAKTGIYGCSHAYIELENTSDQDYPLDGFYLHFTYPSSTGRAVAHLPLKGIIKAGSTFLIRGKQYADFNDKSCFIKVQTYDMEWWNNGELIDFSVDDSLPKNNANSAYALAMTYGMPELGARTQIVKAATEDGLKALGYGESIKVSSAPYLYSVYYVDSLNWYAKLGLIEGSSDSTINPWWPADACIEHKKNSIIKNNFMLDPAKQAFQALTKYDSSRNRGSSIEYTAGGCDLQMLELDNEFITFKYSDEEYPVSNWTPMASYCNKNVSTDKSKLDTEKPNMLTCSFGRNPYTTRCFNWISCGAFDEYIFIKKDGDKNWQKFESYKTTEEMGDEPVSDAYPKRKRFTNKVKDGYYTEAPGSDTVENIIYARITSRFPGCNTLFTAHKLILEVAGRALSSPTKYVYMAGRADKDGNPDLEHCTEEYSFTLYPSNTLPRIYQITDQQGFMWIEYQAWAAAAKKIDEVITAETADNKTFVPVLVNTGDMTQNGTRINEWLDYYNAGKCLFKHLEQCNVVGNNDLCGTDPLVLGTGDDSGKSNSYYFHLFYCYEVEAPTDTTKANTVEKGVIPVCGGKYIPSLYGIKFTNYYLLFVNSEITKINCEQWFKKTATVAGETIPVNIYTAWPISKSPDATYNTTFTSIYTMLYNMMTANRTGAVDQIVAVCHEMPFTVITNNSLSTAANVIGNTRCFSGSKTTGLIGSHLNQIDYNDRCMCWFSRLLEHFKVKLCIGGHKHTFAITYPIREHYLYGDNEDSKTGPMTMPQTLANDNTIWTLTASDEAPFMGMTGTFHLSKFPYVKRNAITVDAGENTFYPYTPIPDLTGGVTYFMCQATGFKLKSNKELPSQKQAFSMLIPETTVNPKTGADKPSPEQQVPMFGIIELEQNQVIKLYLARIQNILNNKSLNQQRPTELNKSMELEYIKTVTENQFGKWVKNSREPVVTL